MERVCSSIPSNAFECQARCLHDGRTKRTLAVTALLYRYILQIKTKSRFHLKKADHPPSSSFLPPPEQKRRFATTTTTSYCQSENTLIPPKVIKVVKKGASLSLFAVQKPPLSTYDTFCLSLRSTSPHTTSTTATTTTIILQCLPPSIIDLGLQFPTNHGRDPMTQPNVPQQTIVASLVQE